MNAGGNYQSIFENAPIGIFRSTVQGKLIEVNEAFAHIFGYASPEEVIAAVNKTSIADALYAMPGQRAVFVEEAVAHGGWRRHELRCRRKDGSIIICLLYFRVIPTNDRSGADLEGFFADISGRKRAEESWRQSEEHLRGEQQLLLSIIDTIPVMITIYDPRTLHFRVNREVEKVLGWTNEEIQHINIMEAAYPDPQYRAKIMRLMQSLKPGWTDMVMTAKDGTRIDSSWANLRLPDGRNVGIGLDMRERRRAEEALRRSESRFRALTENGPLAVAMSRNGMTIYANDRYLQMFGVRSRDELYGHPILEQVAPSRRDELMAWVRRFEERVLGPQQFETVGLRKDGSEFPFYVAVTRVELDDGPAIIGIFIDITERKKAEKELVASEQRTRYILKHNPNAIAVLDRDLRYIMVSDRFLSDYRLGGQDIIGRRHYDVFPEMPQRWKEVHKRALAGSVERCEDDRFVRSDGSIDYNRWEVRPWYDANGGIGGIIMYTEVTTERRRAEEALRRREEEFRILVEQSPDIISRYDRRLRYMYVNPLWSRVTGLSRSTSLGKTNEELGFPRGLVSRWNSELRKVFATGEVRTIEFDLPVAGRTISFHARAVPVRGKGNEIESVITISRDISDLKRIQGELMRASVTAEKRADEAEEARRTLEAMMDNVPEGIMIVDSDGAIRMMSRYMSEITGVARKNTAKRYLDQVEAHLSRETTPFEVVREFPLQRALRRGEKTYSEERMVTRPDGEKMSVVINAVPIRDKSGKIAGALTAWRDITDRKAMEDRLRRNEYELRTLVNNSPDLIVRFDARLRYVYVNPAYERISGLPRERLLGRTNKELGMPDEQMRYWESAVQKVFATGMGESIEFGLQGFFGKRYFRGRVLPEFAKDGSVETVTMISRDITERKLAEERMRYVSFHDTVAGLYNRAFFEEELRLLDHDRELPLSIIAGEINGLKLSNDAFGSDEGDRLLRMIAKILRMSCRKNDIIARLGGDEFAVLLPRTELSAAAGIMERIGQECRRAQGTFLKPSVALGLATRNRRDDSAYRVLREAESAMYRNKLATLEEDRASFLGSLQSVLDRKLPNRGDHTARLKGYIRDAGEAMGLTVGQLRALDNLADLHELGKIAVPPAVLLKRGGLDARESAVMRQYPEAGYRIVRAFDECLPDLETLIAVGERWDGTGYPRRLQGKEIPYLVRLFQVIDAFDVMTHERPYARALSRDEAVKELRKDAGRRFDPELVETYIRRIRPGKTVPA